MKGLSVSSPTMLYDKHRNELGLCKLLTRRELLEERLKEPSLFKETWEEYE